MKKYQAKFDDLDIRVHQVFLFDYLPDVIEKDHPVWKTMAGLSVDALESAFGNAELARKIAFRDKSIAQTLREAGGVFIVAQCGHVGSCRVEFGDDGYFSQWEWSITPQRIYAHAATFDAAMKKLIAVAKEVEAEFLSRVSEEYNPKTGKKVFCINPAV